jgi:cytochrome c peroxidase
MIQPIPKQVKYDRPKALLGQKLFFDPILSKNQTLSCASCHDLNNGGDDNQRFPVGINEQVGKLNTPTVLNAQFNMAQFWNGRAKSLQDQASSPIENPIEMGHDLDQIVSILKSDNYYNHAFIKLFPSGVTKENITFALAEFQKSLITPDSRFDLYLKGDKSALTPEEKEGYRLFKSKGCISCHHGVNMGGNLFAKIGIFNIYQSNSLGRYEITKDDEDKYFFKVPTLRNISQTAPYFHDGRAPNLKEAIRQMGFYQLGRVLKKDEIDKIYKFLLTLEGKVPKLSNE